MERMPHWLPLFALIGCLAVRCAYDPDLKIMIADAKCSVYGSVSPKGSAKVSLITEGDTVATVFADADDGEFVFKDIPYGVYAITAQRDTLFGQRTGLVLNDPVEEISWIELTPSGQLLSFVSLVSGRTITPELLRSDSSASITFALFSDVTLRPDSAVRVVVPASLGTVSIEPYGSRWVIIMEADSLFAADSVLLCLLLMDNSSGLSRPDSVVLAYSIDSTGLNSTRTKKLVSGLEGGPGLDGLSGVDREGWVYVNFSREMDRRSVEERVSTEPAFVPVFKWDGTRLRISPANSWAARTAYTVTIDVGARAADSVRFRCPYSFTFTTDDEPFFYDNWPRNGTVDAPLTASFEYSTSYSLDPVLLREAFSIQPPVDSLAFDNPRTGVVQIRHASLLPDTLYRITIDGALQSRMGTVLGDSLVISFRTASAGN